MEEQVLNSETDKLLKIDKPRGHYQGALLSASILIFIFSILMIYCWATVYEYPLFILIFISGVLPLLLSISLFGSCLRWGTLTLYENRIEMHSIFKLKIKKIYFKDVVKSDEYERHIRYKGGDNHLIFTFFSNNGTSISIRSDLYDSYYHLRTLYRNKHKKHIENRPTILRFLLWRSGLLLGISSLLVSFYDYQTKRDISQNELIVINGTVSDSLKIYEAKSSWYNQSSLSICLEDYTDNSFGLNSPHTFIVKDNNLLQDIKIGDSITLGIEKNEYHRKILKDTPISLIEKLNYSNAVSIYTIQAKDKTYLSLNDYNDKMSSYKKRFMYFWLIAGIVTIYINLKKKPKTVLVENKYYDPHQEGRIRIRQASFNDISAIKKLFRETITHINSKDYTPEQISAWIKRGEDDDMWRSRIITQYFIVVVSESELLGFASITHDGHIDFMFVHHLHQHKGIAAFLFEPLENFSNYCSLSTITVDSSITAKSFFQKMGFYVQKEQSVDIGEILINYRMIRHLHTNLSYRSIPSPEPQHSAHHPLPQIQYHLHNLHLLHKETNP